jgi:hypothetical protein
MSHIKTTHVGRFPGAKRLVDLTCQDVINGAFLARMAGKVAKGK